MTCRDLTAFSPFWHKKILCFSDILIKEYWSLFVPNITNFDAVDFSERRPEEVMFLLTLSVHVL